MGRKSDARERLIRSAVQLMHDRGYSDVGVQELCDCAGAKKGSFYYFFSSKQALALAALDEEWDRARREFWQEALAPDLPPVARIRRFFSVAASRMKEEFENEGVCRGCGFGNLAMDRSTCDEDIRKKVESIFQEGVAYLKGTLDEAVAVGDLPPIDTTGIAQVILAYFQGATLMAKTRQDPEAFRRLSMAFFDLVPILSPEGVDRSVN